MAHFILLTKLTSDGVKTIKNNPDRIAEVNHEMEQIGLKVHHQWATLGRYDFISVVEADSRRGDGEGVAGARLAGNHGQRDAWRDPERGLRRVAVSSGSETAPRTAR